MNETTGQVWMVKGPERELAFHYHDLGYLSLAPCTPFVRSLRISYTASSRTVTTEEQYLYLAGSWMEIRQVADAHTAELRNMMTSTGEADTPVATMRRMSLT